MTYLTVTQIDQGKAPSNTENSYVQFVFLIKPYEESLDCNRKQYLKLALYYNLSKFNKVLT